MRIVVPLLLAGLLTLAGAALADPAPMVLISSARPPAGAIPPATAMVEGAPVTAPPGWTGYCRRASADPAC